MNYKGGPEVDKEGVVSKSSGSELEEDSELDKRLGHEEVRTSA